MRPGALTDLIAALVRAAPVPGWNAPLLEGEVVGGRFEIVREIGRGGFGVVYEAHDRELSRAVAFKALHAAGPRDEHLVAEAEAAAQLAHPNIVHLYDVGRDERGPYLIEPGDARSDVFGLGSLLQELVTGRRPIEASARHAPAPASTGPTRRAPAVLGKLAERMLQPDPAARPRDAVEVHAAIVALQRKLDPRRLSWTAWAVAGAALAAGAVLALRGRRRAALALLDAQRPHPGAPVQDAMHHFARASHLWGDGDVDGVWREVEAMLSLGTPAVSCLAHLLASMGDLSHAARLAALWPDSDPRLACNRLYRHVRDWKRGDREGAASALVTVSWGSATLHRGEILAELGRDREAVEAFRRFRRDPVSGDRLLALWSHADPEIPTLREARALRARCVGSGR